MPRKIVSETRRCGYHFGGDEEDCREAQLRASPKEGWQVESVWLCPDCRDYLRGLFRYVREARDARTSDG